MIRALLLSLAAISGLAVAAVTEGRMRHLRAVAADRMPAVTAGVADDAGVLHGSASLGEDGGATVNWSAMRPTLAGLNWQLDVDAPGISADALLLLPWRFDHARLLAPRGDIELSEATPTGTPALAGLVRIQGGAGRVDDLASAPRLSGTLDALWRGAMFQDVPLGDGPLTGEIDPLQSWRVSFALDGGVAPIEGSLTGRIPQTSAALQLQVRETGDLPEAWRRALALAGSRTETGWSLNQRVDLR